MWNILLSTAFSDWLEQQDEPLVEDVLTTLNVLKTHGPRLGRPWVDHVKGSRFINMTELRIQTNGRPVRLFFAFDPRRSAIILCSGNKQGEDSETLLSKAYWTGRSVLSTQS